MEPTKRIFSAPCRHPCGATCCERRIMMMTTTRNDDPTIPYVHGRCDAMHNVVELLESLMAGFIANAKLWRLTGTSGEEGAHSLHACVCCHNDTKGYHGDVD